MICTFKDCNKQSSHELENKEGEIWANVCDEHFELYEYLGSEKCIKENGAEFVAKKQISFWIKASGGAGMLAKKILN